MTSTDPALKHVAAIFVCLTIPLPGCASRQEQLHRVAKDWCETIRASQVVPIYPLTQDLQPGDVFLVQIPIDKQQTIYKEDGFLPLDNHLARLEPGGYSDFYEYSFLDPNNPRQLPKDWMTANWASATRVAFPTYGFRFTAASARSVSMTETFDKPLVVGYLGFDVPIGVDGELGGPIPTFNIVSGQPISEPIKRVGAFTSAEASYKQHYETVLKLIARADQDSVFARAAELLGGTSESTYNDQVGKGKNAWQAWSEVFNALLPRGLRSRSERERRYKEMSKALNESIREYLDSQ